jgi:hypothetical protein
VCWQSAGVCITTQSGCTYRWAQIARPNCVADLSFPEAWESGKQRTLPTFPHPRPRQRVISIARRATLTISPVQKIGQTTCCQTLAMRGEEMAIAYIIVLGLEAITALVEHISVEGRYFSG